MNYFIFGYANSVSDLTAEKIAFEGLAILVETPVLSGYVATDFQNQVADPGDVVRAPYPVEMTANRIPEGSSATVNNLTTGSHLVTLNQHISQAFSIGDREQQRSFVEISEFFIAPAVRSMANMANDIIQGEKYRSYKSTVGKIGTALAYTDILAAGKLQTKANVPAIGRNMFIGADAGADIRNMDKFVDNVSSTDPSLVRMGAIGAINGYMVHETNSFSSVDASTRVTGAVNSASMVKGTTSVTVDGFSAAITTGSWCTIDGVPYRITGTTGGSTPTAIAIESPGLRDAVANDAVVYVYTPAVVNTGTTYPVGYEGAIGWDGAVTPKIDQGVSFGTDGDPYSIIAVSSTEIWLNRPVDVAIANDVSAFLMPAGNYGLGLYRNSIQLVNRPLALPRANQGVDAYVASGMGWSIRVMSSYDILAKKTTYAMDFIMGIATIDENANVIVLG